jgi:2-polyprenyl-6-methoxyphenol hydroxylase-like FAD-dependent oxidoreductase
MKAIVVGAGIGGLTIALSLHRHGIAVDVFEQSPAVRELGVGFNILPPAVAELAALGLVDAFDEVAIRTSTRIMTNRRGQPIMTDRRGLAAGLPFPQFSIHRGCLQRLLADALHARAGHVIHVDHRLHRFAQDRDGVRADFVDRAGSPCATVEADVLVGADGIHSTVRATLVPGEGDPLWNGSMMWRGATVWPAFLDGRTMIVAGGNDGKLVVYPIAPGRTSATRLTNWAIVGGVAAAGSPPPPPARSRDVWSQQGRRDDLAPHLDRFTSDLVDVAGLVAATDELFEYPMCDREPLARWSHGRVTLLGDAAHPMYPMGSNGATQAIIDAANLAGHLACGAVAGALRAYEVDRLEATNRLVRMNRVGGPERVIDLVEELAPQGFDDIDDVIAPDELRRILVEYAAAGRPVTSGPRTAVARRS